MKKDRYTPGPLQCGVVIDLGSVDTEHATFKGIVDCDNRACPRRTGACSPRIPASITGGVSYTDSPLTTAQFNRSVDKALNQAEKDMRSTCPYGPQLN